MASTANKPKELDPKKLREPVDSDLPRYRVTQNDHYINGVILRPGDEVVYLGEPGVLLEPLNTAAEEAHKQAVKARKERHNKKPVVEEDDPEKF